MNRYTRTVLATLALLTVTAGTARASSGDSIPDDSVPTTDEPTTTTTVPADSYTVTVIPSCDSVRISIVGEITHEHTLTVSIDGAFTYPTFTGTGSVFVTYDPLAKHTITVAADNGFTVAGTSPGPCPPTTYPPDPTTTTSAPPSTTPPTVPPGTCSDTANGGTIVCPEATTTTTTPTTTSTATPTVPPPTTPPPTPTLPHTGAAKIVGISTSAFALILAGVGALLLTRRRPTRS